MIGAPRTAHLAFALPAYHDYLDAIVTTPRPSSGSVEWFPAALSVPPEPDIARTPQDHLPPKESAGCHAALRGVEDRFRCSRRISIKHSWAICIDTTNTSDGCPSHLAAQARITERLNSFTKHKLQLRKESAQTLSAPLTFRPGSVIVSLGWSASTIRLMNGNSPLDNGCSCRGALPDRVAWTCSGSFFVGIATRVRHRR